MTPHQQQLVASFIEMDGTIFDMLSAIEAHIDQLHNDNIEVDPVLYDLHADVCGHIIEQQKG